VLSDLNVTSDDFDAVPEAGARPVAKLPHTCQSTHFAKPMSVGCRRSADRMYFRMVTSIVFLLLVQISNFGVNLSWWEFGKEVS
jgi:hypothetical protein